MNKYKVLGTGTVTASLEVEAESPEEAAEKAKDYPIVYWDHVEEDFVTILEVEELGKRLI